MNHDGPVSVRIGWTLGELHELRRGLELREPDLARLIDAQRTYPAAEAVSKAQPFLEQYVINRSLHTAICERIFEVEMQWVQEGRDLPDVPGWSGGR